MISKAFFWYWHTKFRPYTYACVTSHNPAYQKSSDEKSRTLNGSDMKLPMSGISLASPTLGINFSSQKAPRLTPSEQPGSSPHKACTTTALPKMLF
jgi:hypothetical protein